MNRRELVTLLCVAAVSGTATAQTRRNIPLIGILSTHPATNAHMLDALRQGLRALGYVERESINVEIRWTEGHPERIPELIAELVGLNPDALILANSTAALAARDATRTIPIIMFAGDPVALGLVASLARPGGNVTGLSFFNSEISGKRLELIKELVPGLVRVAVLRNSTVTLHAASWQQSELVAGKLGLVLKPVEVHGPEDFEAAFATIRDDKSQALLALDDPLTVAYRHQVIALAARNRVPAIYGFREFTDDGGLVSYGPNFVMLFRRAATFVDKILKGAKPADLPVEQPTKFELVINLNTAKALGLTVPQSLLARADEVIE